MPALLLTVLVALGPAPQAGASHAAARPCVESPSAGSPATRPCLGPITNESGGGGGSATIIVSVVVGLAVASGAMVLVHRRLRSSAR